MKTNYRFILLIWLAAFFSGKAIAQDPVADNMLLYQRSVGGWPKAVGEVKVDYNQTLDEAKKAGVIDDKGRNDATIDNNATNKEIRYLIKAYQKTNNKAYLKAAEQGINYLLKMQHANGGWPQFYPDSSSYRSQITFNDNAMINVLNVLWDVTHHTNGFELVDPSLVKPSEKAIKKGVDCILQTQIKVKGKLTAWCAQYDKKTMQPAKARAFELISLSGSESVGIVAFLMKIENPSPEIIHSVNSAIEWFQAVKIEGFNFVDVKDPSLPNGKDRLLQPDPTNTIWARFYDIDTNKPFFSGRDSNKKWTVAEIEYERRNGYAWYGTWPKNLLEKEYPVWKKAHS
jgi:PelA/Pel-15E family pectate lyase